MSLENSVLQSPQNVPKVGNFVAKNCQKSEFSLFRKWHFRMDRSTGCLVAEKYRVIDRGGWYAVVDIDQIMNFANSVFTGA